MNKFAVKKGGKKTKPAALSGGGTPRPPVQPKKS